MATEPLPTPQHEVLRFAGEVREQAPALMSRVAFMTTADTAQALREIHAAESGVLALKLALIAHADHIGVAAADACVNMEAWLRTHLLLEPRDAKRQVKLARQLEDPAHEATRVAFAAGELTFTAVRIVLDAVDGLPSVIDPDKRHQAERHLLGLSKLHDAGDLRRLARHLDEVVNPEGAEQREADALARAEAKAARAVWCHVWFDETTQTSTGSFKADLLTGRKVHRILEALMNPARPDPIPLKDEDGNRISADERRGQALVELINGIAKTGLPKTGGCDPVVVVTMSLETLTGGLKAAGLDTGERISPHLARRLAARHGVIPTVLGTKSQILDLGRRTRLFTKTQRIAMSVQQNGTCATEGCDRPAAWADAHHLQQWQTGGPTDIANGVLICRRHHSMADHSDYTVERIAPGRIRINRRT